MFRGGAYSCSPSPSPTSFRKTPLPPSSLAGAECRHLEAVGNIFRSPHTSSPHPPPHPDPGDPPPPSISLLPQTRPPHLSPRQCMTEGSVLAACVPINTGVYACLLAVLAAAAACLLPHTNSLWRSVESACFRVFGTLIVCLHLLIALMLAFLVTGTEIFRHLSTIAHTFPGRKRPF